MLQDLFLDNKDLAEEGKESGMKMSVDHADRKHEKWSDKAYKIFIELVSMKEGQFLSEEIRMEAEKVLPKPPSNRAWGSVTRRAAKEGIIIFCGYSKTTNPLAHRTPAAMWERG